MRTLRAKDFRLNKCFSTFRALLAGGLVSVYRRSKDFAYSFKTFDRGSGLAHIPQTLRAEALGEEGVCPAEELRRASARVSLSKACERYFEIRGSLDPVDLEQLRQLEKTVRGVLIRKGILQKKQVRRELQATVQGIRQIKTTHVGELKRLQLEIEDEISCLRLFQRIADEAQAPKPGLQPKTPAGRHKAQAGALWEALSQNVQKKKGAKTEIIALTKEIFKLNFKVEENSGCARNRRPHLRQAGDDSGGSGGEDERVGGGVRAPAGLLRAGVRRGLSGDERGRSGQAAAEEKRGLAQGADRREHDAQVAAQAGAEVHGKGHQGGPEQNLNKDLEDYDFKILKLEKRSVLIQNYNLSQLQTSKLENRSKEQSRFKFHSEQSEPRNGAPGPDLTGRSQNRLGA